MELHGILTPEERALGFELREVEDFVYLLRWGKEIAVFSSKGVTAEEVHLAIAAELANDAC